MTLEERFKDAAAALVAAHQDLACLREVLTEQQQRLTAARSLARAMKAKEGADTTEPNDGLLHSLCECLQVGSDAS